MNEEIILYDSFSRLDGPINGSIADTGQSWVGVTGINSLNIVSECACGDETFLSSTIDLNYTGALQAIIQLHRFGLTNGVGIGLLKGTPGGPDEFGGYYCELKKAAVSIRVEIDDSVIGISPVGILPGDIVAFIVRPWESSPSRVDLSLVVNGLLRIFVSGITRIPSNTYVELFGADEIPTIESFTVKTI